ncbi:hypothetical protein HKD37_04G010718 [Glycine soja]
MATPPSSLPPPLPSPTEAASQSSSTLKQTRKATRLRSLATRPIGADRPVVHVDPTTRKIDARDKVDVAYKNWKQVHAAHKELIWEDIQVFSFSSCMKDGFV